MFDAARLSALPPGELARLARALTPRLTRYVPWGVDPATGASRPGVPRPTPRQAAFLLLPHREALYGGGRGGGKSEALLMAALQYVDVPGYAALLLRRTFPDLTQPQGLIDRLDRWLAPWRAKGEAHWDGNDHEWTFPSESRGPAIPRWSNPAKVRFGHMENERDKEKYQGGEYQLLGFEEGTQFTETQYTFTLGSLRAARGMSIPETGKSVPLRARITSNPPDPLKPDPLRNGSWVKERFISKPVYLDPVDGRPRRRAFVPALMRDNPHLDHDEYRRSLAQLDELTRKVMEEGLWDVKAPGRLWRADWFERVARAPEGLEWVSAWDMAATEPGPGNPDPDWSANVKAASVGSGLEQILYLRKPRAWRRDAGEMERIFASVAREDGDRVKQWVEQEPGSGGKYAVDSFARGAAGFASVEGERATGAKIDRWRPLLAQAQRRKVVLVEEGAEDVREGNAWGATRVAGWGPFLEMLEAIDPSRGDNGPHDDFGDASALAKKKADEVAAFVWR